jgi:hypothetical protein
MGHDSVSVKPSTVKPSCWSALDLGGVRWSLAILCGQMLNPRGVLHQEPGVSAPPEIDARSTNHSVVAPCTEDSES